ncbi:(dimethylallyl)adenosine tRNA methylthiotransferase [Klebsiella variicola]|uniref:(Dimethylallyl)adenosine tRNA methylthiotransferase n=1 Tax=Klebsiella variicola TaxID=244366 RepID=A0A7H4MFR2_KLEVA|nr:(dimethylallyl)adenosine tRNA methylthiotransferase [Klebsiella variicola]
MTKKLHIKTWGCQMNEYDSSKMADLLDATHGYQLTEVAEEADVLLLNTCSIREKAQEKVFHQLGRWKLLKEKKPDLIIGVGGCVASQGRRPYSSARTLCRYYFRAANPAPPAGDD